MTRFRMAESLDLGSGNQGEWELHLLPPSFCHATAAPVPTYTTSWGPSSPPSHFILPLQSSLLLPCAYVVECAGKRRQTYDGQELGGQHFHQLLVSLVQASSLLWASVSSPANEGLLL